MHLSTYLKAQGHLCTFQGSIFTIMNFKTSPLNDNNRPYVNNNTFHGPWSFSPGITKTRNLKELFSISPPIISPGFTTQNDHIMSTKDACDMPAQRNVTMRPCGRDKISYDDCYQAGCCYKDGECYLPFVEEKVDYLFYSQKMRFKDARKECRKAGLNSFAVPENSNCTHTLPYYFNVPQTVTNYIYFLSLLH